MKDRKLNAKAIHESATQMLVVFHNRVWDQDDSYKKKQVWKSKDEKSKENKKTLSNSL